MNKKIKIIFTYLLFILLLLITGCSSNINYVNDLNQALNNTIDQISSKYDLDNITNDIELIGSDNNYIYKFISSNEDVISNEGIVNRKLQDETVIITIRVYKDQLFVSGNIDCIVKAVENNTEYQDLRKALDNTINNIINKYDLNNITSDIQLIGYDSKYTYEFISSNENVISNTGKVTRQSTNQEVTIIIKISYNNYSITEQIECVVIAKVITDGYTYDVENTKSKLKISELNNVNENEEYNNYLDVIAYIHYFHKLPSNYLTKSEAKSKGWKGSGNVWVNDSLRGKNIGGDTFNNYEKLLPVLSNYPYIEVDVNCSNGSRGKYRIVYNKYTFDIYYTDDHYESFTYMIGELQ